MFEASNKPKKEVDEKIITVEEKVDRILEENKEKLAKLNFTEVDLEQFSLKNKEGNKIFYLRKKSESNEKDEAPEVLSKKIIKEAKTNLGEKTNKPKDKPKDVKDEKENEIVKKRKIRIRFGKRPKEVEPVTKESIIKSEELDEIVSEIEKNNKKETKAKKKTIKSKATQKKEPKDIEKESTNITFPTKTDLENKKPEIDGKEESDFVSSTTDNLAELKKKYAEKIKIPEIEEESEKLEKDKKEEIKPKEEPKEPLVEDFKESLVEDKGVKGASKKPSFFNKEKPPETKPTKLTDDQIIGEQIVNKPTFRVDNLPKKEDLDDDERKLLDDEIVLENEEVEILQYPKQLGAFEKGILRIKWSPSVEVKKGLQTSIKISGKELYS